jgi:DNA polymerase III subunit delta
VPSAAASPPTLTLIVGSESYLVERAITHAKAVLKRIHPDVQFTIVDGGDDGVAQALAQAASPNLFGDATLVIVHDIDQLDDDGDAALRSLIEQMPDDVWLIATHPGGVKGKARLEALRTAGAHEIDAAVLKKGKIPNFLAHEIARHKRKATSDALQALVDAIGFDIRMLVAAIDQLVSDVTHDPITADDVRETFAGMAEIAGWTIADRVWERNAQAALTDLRWSMNTSDGSRIGSSTVAALARGLRNLVLVGTSAPGASDGDVARDVGIQPWQVSSLRRQWAKWSGDRRRAAHAIVVLADADAAMKGGVGAGTALDSEQKAFELERLVMRLAARASQEP